MAQLYMDDEEWMYEENPEDASRFHVIVIDSDVQTRSPCIGIK